MNDFSFITNAHPNFIDSLYEQYQQDPEQVEASWRNFFKGYDYAQDGNGHTTNGLNGAATAVAPDKIRKELQVHSLIIAYRNRGHLESTTNPLRPRRNRNPKLELQDFGLSDADLNTVFMAGNEIGLQQGTLEEIVSKLKKIYCGNIGFEFHHIQDREKRRWLRTKIESYDPDHQYGFDLKKKSRILEKLNGAVVFEEFLHKKFIGQKRFSLEGGETTIVALDGIINKSVEMGPTSCSRG